MVQKLKQKMLSFSEKLYKNRIALKGIRLLNKFLLVGEEKLYSERVFKKREVYNYIELKNERYINN